MVKKINVTVLDNKMVTRHYGLMRLACEKPLGNVQPGQFIYLKLPTTAGGIPFLRRPFSIYDYELAGKKPVISLLYKIVGQGTKQMSRLKKGTSLNLLGPLGHGYKINKQARTSILVAGGIGIAGIHLLLKQLNKLQTQKRIYLLLGVRTKSELYIPPVSKSSEIKVLLSTEDGSYGECGFVTGLLEKVVTRLSPVEKKLIQVYACGPQAMAQAVAGVTMPLDIPCQLSLEARMACGLGFCRGCVVPIYKNGIMSYASVCEDGPVFEARQINPGI